MTRIDRSTTATGASKYMDDGPLASKPWKLPEDPRSSERTIISTADARQPSVRWALRLLVAATIALLLLATAGPLLWLAKSAVSTTADVNADPFSLWPSGIQLQNLVKAWTELQIGQATLNTVMLASGVVILSLIVQFSGGYLLAILRPKYGPILNALIMSTLFIPAVISLIPLYLTVTELHMLNTYWGVWLPGAASAFNILIFKQFFERIPREIFEAARIDGVGEIRMIWTILAPMSRPVVGVVVLLTFVSSWKDFLWPLLVLPNPNLQPLSVALSTASETTEGAILLAGMLITVIVPIALFIAFQRQFLQGAGSAGAVKG